MRASIDISSLEFQLIPVEYSWKSTGEMLQGKSFLQIKNGRMFKSEKTCQKGKSFNRSYPLKETHSLKRLINIDAHFKIINVFYRNQSEDCIYL